VLVFGRFRGALAPALADVPFQDILPKKRHKEVRMKAHEGDVDEVIWRSTLHRCFNPLSRPLIIAATLLAVTTMALLRPLWPVSPGGHGARLKLSSLDLVRERIERRRAAREATGRDWPAALETWRSAMQTNPFDAQAYRGLLQAFVHGTNTTAVAGELRAIASRLLDLSRTNQNDVVLVACAFMKCRRYGDVCALLKPLESALGPDLEGLFLQSLFEQGRISDFQARTERAGAALRQNPMVALYAAAAQAGTGSSPEADAATAQLEAAAREGPLRNRADHLLLGVAERRGDVRLAQSALRRLQEADAETLGDHVALWRLLASRGRKREAIQLARTCHVLPGDTEETRQAVGVLRALGLEERALALLRCACTPNSHDRLLDVHYAGLLIRARRFDELRELERSLSLRARSQPTLYALSWFCETMALWELRQAGLRPLPTALPGVADIQDPPLALELVGLVVDLGLYDDAAVLLSAWRAKLQGDARYWSLLATVAERQKNETALALATRPEGEGRREKAEGRSAGGAK
jgi:hypothetical protein